MKKTHITYEQAANALGYKKSHFLQKALGTWSVESRDDGTYRIVGEFNPLCYALVAVGGTIVGIPYAMWNSGLRNFKLPDRTFKRSVVFPGEAAEGRMAEMGLLA